jgi:monovalent cation/hydrogen antiporter
VLAMLMVVVLARGVGERIGVPFSILLTVAGLLYATLPGPKLDLDPEVVLLLVLPPLLSSTAPHGDRVCSRSDPNPRVAA